MVPFELVGLLCLSLPLFTLALPTEPQQELFHDPAVRPVVLWHGMGDSHSSPAMLEFMELVKEMHPGIFVHSIFIEEGLDADQRAGLWGNVNDQVEQVAAQLANVTELKDGFDAVGFSQGGQFLRAFVERFNSPPVHNLLTFGSQHMGVADLPLCRNGDILCQIARSSAKRGVYTDWAQRSIVQAQYFRDPSRLSQYFEHNRFLVSINNEYLDPALINATYAKNLASLSNLILVIWTDDVTVVPKESSWFGSYEPTDGEEWGQKKTLIPMRLQPIYLHDVIGLRSLDEAGRVHLETCEGTHMHLSDECWKPLFKRFVGGRT